uniref:Uncharacterized protein n=1 Tax=Fundulus heteroclitus TaxID=8078 RepID=A0A3Q2U083_FUNHE
IVTSILWYFCDLPFQTCPVDPPKKPTKRAITAASNDWCLKRYGGVELNYTVGATTTFQVDLCDIIKCGSKNNHAHWRGYDVYLCGTCILRPLEPHLESDTGFKKNGQVGVNPLSYNNTEDHSKTEKQEQQVITSQGNTVIKMDYSTLEPLEIIQMATGYANDNLWLNWMAETAREQSQGDCVACATARPHLTTEPAPLIFPPIPNNTRAGLFTPRNANGTYTCFNFTNSKPKVNVGEIPADWCNDTLPGKVIGAWARSGLTVGVCAMVRLKASIMLLGSNITAACTLHDKSIQLTHKRRGHIMKRSTPNFNLGEGSPTYMDAIGVPRGVPGEYKLADEVAAGFENIPWIVAIFPITPNKNVDRINYIHYNQLGQTSLMAVQNHMALDMLLAEKGGVCAMFGDMCCKFIPNNTAPDGSVTKALEGLRTLSETIHEHSGISDPLEEWIALFVAILVTCGCCFIPCIRSLTVRLKSSTIEKQDPRVMMPLLVTAPEEENKDTGFELMHV